jgi:hypothetical protein
LRSHFQVAHLRHRAGEGLIHCCIHDDYFKAINIPAK